MNTQSPIGFLAQRHNPAIVSLQQDQEQDGSYLVRFDDGTGITFDDANYNVLVLGSTGSGKTSSVIMPAVHNVFVAGYYGLIIDIKGNLGPQVRALAASCGREADIVELGTSSQATPVNLLAGMADVELRNLFEDLFYKQNLSSNNEDFHQHGIEYVLDICRFLRIVHAFDKRYALSLEIVDRLLRNPAEGHQLYAQFLEKWFNKDNQEHLKLYMALKNSTFHPLCAPSNDTSNYWEQYAYATHGILGSISMLMTTPAIVQNFFSGNTTLDLKSLVYDQKKVVLLRFAAQAEAAGEILSRILLSMFYRVMLSPCALALGKDEKTFVIIDEFQQILDLTGRFSDDKVLARSREFNNIFLVASQSMAGMYAKAGGNKLAVHAMLTNFREKLIFNCDDPDTYEWIQRYGVDAKYLPLGEVAALRGRESEQATGISKFLHKAHASAQKLVKSASTQGCDLCEVEVRDDDVPPIARYQRSTKELKSILTTYREAEIAFTKPLHANEFAEFPNGAMWLELAKKFSDCFVWEPNKTKQVKHLFNKSGLQATHIGQMCKALSRIKGVGLLPKIEDFTFLKSKLVLKTNQGKDMDRSINAIAADISLLQKEQVAYMEDVQLQHSELQVLERERDFYMQEVAEVDDYEGDCCIPWKFDRKTQKIDELRSIIKEKEANADCDALWCASCSENRECTLFKAYKELSCADSQTPQKKPRLAQQAPKREQ